MRNRLSSISSMLFAVVALTLGAVGAANGTTNYHLAIANTTQFDVVLSVDGYRTDFGKDPYICFEGVDTGCLVSVTNSYTLKPNSTVYLFFGEVKEHGTCNFWVHFNAHPDPAISSTAISLSQTMNNKCQSVVPIGSNFPSATAANTKYGLWDSQRQMQVPHTVTLSPWVAVNQQTVNATDQLADTITKSMGLDPTTGWGSIIDKGLKVGIKLIEGDTAKWKLMTTELYFHMSIQDNLSPYP